MRFLVRVVVGLIALGGAVLALPVTAQTNLQYGTAISGHTAASYSFSGREGDLVTTEAVGISAGLIPVLTLLNANGQQLAQSQDDPLTPGTTTLHARLPFDGDYTLDVTDMYGKSGDFVLSLSARPIMSARALSEGRTTVYIDATPQAFHFAGPAELHLISPDSSFSAEIHSLPGELIAEIGDLPSAVFALDSTGEYEMMLHTTGAAATVEIDYLERPDLLATPETQTGLLSSDRLFASLTRSTAHAG